MQGDDIYLLTHKESPRFKVVRTSLAQPDMAHAEVVVPEGETSSGIVGCGGRALCRRPMGAGLLDRVAYGGRRRRWNCRSRGNVDASDARIPGVILDDVVGASASDLFVNPRAR